MLVQRRGRRVGAERGLPEQQLIDDAAQGVHVGGRVGGPPQRPLGGQVEAGADDVTGRRQRGRGIVDELGDPEVADLHRTVRVQHQVARLDVAVDDALAVRRGKAGGRLSGDPGDQFRADALLGGQQVAEALPLDQLHHQEEPVLPGAEVEHGHQMRMAQPGGGLGLQPEAGGRRGVRLVPQQELHGHGPSQDLVRGAPHLAHAATPDGGYQSVPTSYQHLYTYLEWWPAPAVGTPGHPVSGGVLGGAANDMIRISVRRSPDAPTAPSPGSADGPPRLPAPAVCAGVAAAGSPVRRAVRGKSAPVTRQRPRAPAGHGLPPRVPRTPPAAAPGAPHARAAPHRSGS